MCRTLIVSWILALSVVVSAAEPVPAPAFPWNRVEGIQTKDFKPALLEKVAATLATLPCYGRCQESIAACLKKEPTHGNAVRLARGAFLLMAEGKTPEEVAHWLDLRRQMALMEEEKIHSFRLASSVPLGPADAPVVLVEFSDFQCPYCAVLAPALEEIVRASKGKACLYFKHFPLKSHPQALDAARASLAAVHFGKFWEYAQKLFESQKDLSDEALLRIATELDIPTEAFQAELAKEDILDRIADDKMEGLMFRIKGTPAVFVNGKELLLNPTPDLIRDRVQEELDMQAGTD